MCKTEGKGWAVGARAGMELSLTPFTKTSLHLSFISAWDVKSSSHCKVTPDKRLQQNGCWPRVTTTKKAKTHTEMTASIQVHTINLLSLGINFSNHTALCWQMWTTLNLHHWGYSDHGLSAKRKIDRRGCVVLVQVWGFRQTELTKKKNSMYW